MSKLAISTALFDGYDMAVAFDEIAAAGFERVEPAYITGYTDFTEATFSEQTARKLVAQAEQARLEIAAISAHMDLGSPDSSVPDRLQQRIRFAATCDCHVLITNAGMAADAGLIAQRIEAALPLCEDAGVMLALENPGHGTGAAIIDARSGQEFVARFAHRLLQINYDAGNVYSYSGGQRQPGDDLAQSGTKNIGYLHLKDIRSEGDGWAFSPIGSGMVDFASVLIRVPPDLPISLELPLRLSRPQKGDPVRQAERLPLQKLRQALRGSTLAIAAMPTCP